MDSEVTIGLTGAIVVHVEFGEFLRDVVARNEPICDANAPCIEDRELPIVSTFFGIIVRMYYGDHSPPHFHIEYQGQRATFTFNGELLAGELRSKNARRLIREWAKRHNEELVLNWQRIEEGREILRIEPLE